MIYNKEYIYYVSLKFKTLILNYKYTLEYILKCVLRYVFRYVLRYVLVVRGGVVNR